VTELHLMAGDDREEDARDHRAESAQVALAGQPVHRQRRQREAEEEVDRAHRERVVREQADHLAAEEQVQLVGMGEPARVLMEGRTEIWVGAVPTVVENILELRQAGDTVTG